MPCHPDCAQCHLDRAWARRTVNAALPTWRHRLLGLLFRGLLR